MYKTLVTPLRNRARQRRDYLSLSFAWHERAVMAERFSGHPGFPVVALALHAARLDCLLEAALAAFDLDLIGPAEERETWWWIYSITTRRIQLPLRDTWTAKWAESWSFLAGAMQYVGGCDCFLG